MSQTATSQGGDSQVAVSSTIENSVLCDCNRSAKVMRAWTRENPGRRFFSCRGRRVSNGYDSCNFFRWFDVERPQGWQHLALLEARDIIKEQKEEIAMLKNKVSPLSLESDNLGDFSGIMEKFNQKNEECEALKREVLILSERSSVLRNVLVSSSIGFAVVIGGIMAMWKCS